MRPHYIKEAYLLPTEKAVLKILKAKYSTLAQRFKDEEEISTFIADLHTEDVQTVAIRYSLKSYIKELSELKSFF